MKIDSPKLVLWLAGLVVFLWLSVSVGVWFLFDSTQDRGSFGDMFGVINALFSGLAFAGVIYAILLQREELRLQRKELTMTREELARSAEAQEELVALNRQQTQMQRSNYNWEVLRGASERQPNLGYSGTHTDEDSVAFHIVNEGFQITDLSAEPLTDSYEIELPRHFSPGSEGELIIYGPRSWQSAKFVLWYTDVLGHRAGMLYSVNRPNCSFSPRSDLVYPPEMEGKVTEYE